MRGRFALVGGRSTEQGRGQSDSLPAGQRGIVGRGKGWRKLGCTREISFNFPVYREGPAVMGCDGRAYVGLPHALLESRIL